MAVNTVVGKTDGCGQPCCAYPEGLSGAVVVLEDTLRTALIEGGMIEPAN